MGNIKKIFLSLFLFVACACTAFADNVFTPLNFSDGNSNYTTTAANKIAVTTTSAQTTTPVINTDVTGSKNMQSAITQLDNAQVEVRNELLNYKTKYAEVDAKYTAIKEERANLAKQVKASEKKIKQLDNAKEKIRKNME